MAGASFEAVFSGAAVAARRGVSGWDITVCAIKCGEGGRVGGEIGSGLYAPDLRETSPISSPVVSSRPCINTQRASPPPPPYLFRICFRCLRAVAESIERRGGEGRERETERKRERDYRRSSILHRAMAGGPVILSADPWERSDVTEEKLQSLVEAGLLRPITDPNEPE